MSKTPFRYFRASVLVLLIGGLVCSGFGFGNPKLAQAQEIISDYSSDITINQDGSLLIVETINYDFGTAERHGIFRTIPYKYKARGGTFKHRLGDFKVTDQNDQEIQFDKSTSSGDIVLKIGNPNQTISGARVYKISYTVKRAINYFDDHDELYWNPVGTGWDVSINKASATVRAPAAISKVVCYTGVVNSTEQNCSIAGGNTPQVIFNTTKLLNPGEGLTFVVGLPPGTLDKPTTTQKIKDITLDNGILLLPLLVLGLMFYLWNRYGKDPKRKNSIVAQYEAPEKMSSLYLGTLIHGKTTNKDITSEVVYLAANGFLTITRLETSKILGFKGTDYEFSKLEKPPTGLAPQTKALLDALFPGGVTINKLSDLKSDITFGKELMNIRSEVMAELVKTGYYKQNARIMAGVSVVVGFVLAVGGSFLFGNLIGFLGVISAILSGLIVIGFSFIMPARTQKGADTAAEIAGLKEYLSVAEKDRLKFHNAPEKNPKHFEVLLPFAIALGVEQAWAGQFKGLTQAPSWYRDSTGNAFSAIAFSNSMNSFSSSMQSAVSSVATSASGGSGFSGGGSGGGGGGGGGSW